MEAKYRIAGRPIAERVVDAVQLSLVSFPAFFDHVLCHELSHALGPGIITTPHGKKLEWKNLVEELHSTIEECKADVVGLRGPEVVEAELPAGGDVARLRAALAPIRFREPPEMVAYADCASMSLEYPPPITLYWELVPTVFPTPPAIVT